MRFHKIYFAKHTFSLPVKQTIISLSYQPLISYLEVTDNILLNQKPPIKISFVNPLSKLFLDKFST